VTSRSIMAAATMSSHAPTPARGRRRVPPTPRWLPEGPAPRPGPRGRPARRRDPAAARGSRLLASEVFTPDAGTGPDGDRVAVTTEDLAGVLVETDEGITGQLAISQVSWGRTNRLQLDVDAARASFAFCSEQEEQLCIGDAEGARRLPAAGPLIPPSPGSTAQTGRSDCRRPPARHRRRCPGSAGAPREGPAGGSSQPDRDVPLGTLTATAALTREGAPPPRPTPSKRAMSPEHSPQAAYLTLGEEVRGR
jgi:hypothetical protein